MNLRIRASSSFPSRSGWNSVWGIKLWGSNSFSRVSARHLTEGSPFVAIQAVFRQERNLPLGRKTSDAVIFKG
jgi:hypothetical protein